MTHLRGTRTPTPDVSYALPAKRPVRACRHPGCGTILAQDNLGVRCSTHSEPIWDDKSDASTQRIRRKQLDGAFPADGMTEAEMAIYRSGAWLGDVEGTG